MRFGIALTQDEVLTPEQAAERLHLSEAHGALWESYDGVHLKITQSVWRTHVGPCKTEAREAPFYIIR